jgi:hypothetical protein
LKEKRCRGVCKDLDNIHEVLVGIQELTNGVWKKLGSQCENTYVWIEKSANTYVWSGKSREYVRMNLKKISNTYVWIR